MKDAWRSEYYWYSLLVARVEFGFEEKLADLSSTAFEMVRDGWRAGM